MQIVGREVIHEFALQHADVRPAVKRGSAKRKKLNGRDRMT